MNGGLSAAFNFLGLDYVLDVSVVPYDSRDFGCGGRCCESTVFQSACRGVGGGVPTLVGLSRLTGGGGHLWCGTGGEGKNIIRGMVAIVL